ncbi:MAG: TetR/AcrR family bet gene transcriptional repressor [Candidatus Azotimanducaceae bacterium]|jgi:TetR/AcrR family transcriptional repressor of bet genes
MPKKVDHQDRRMALAIHAVEVIAEKGIENMRLVDVARRMGVTTGLVTHYFEDKDAVLLAALEHVAGELVWHDEESSLTNSPRDVFDYLIEILPLDESRRLHWKVWIAFWSRALNNPLLADVHRQYNVTFREELVEIIERFELHADPVASADAVNMTIDSIATHATIEPDYWSAERQRKQLNMMFEALFGKAAVRS